MSVDLHRHTQFSLFDGFNNSKELAELAKAKGYTALGISDHGTVSGLVDHFFQCKAADIKPILGSEVYFYPKFTRETNTRYHLCLFAKNLKGYENLNKIMTEGNTLKFFYKPIADFETLERFSEGIVCTSACIGGYISQALAKGDMVKARKAAKKFISIFGDNFYIEIQPYTLHGDEGLQERVNVALIKLAKELNIKCILTSDSHYGSKEHWPTYLLMHEMNGTKYDVGQTYGERYMPDVGEMSKRFIKMHGGDFTNVKQLAKQLESNLQQLEDSIEGDFLDTLPLTLPKVEPDKDSKKVLQQHIIRGLKARGKYTSEYIERCKQEYEIIVFHGYDDYFLIVEDYVKWAKDNGIKVGPGRGSVCNCLVAYALGITEVDSIYFDLEFTRFLRMDKKKYPDIDLDFETARRDEVLQYIISKYKDRTIQISSYGTFKSDNLLNELFKVCGVEDSNIQADMKRKVKEHLTEDAKGFKYKECENERWYKDYNTDYNNIMVHFGYLYGKCKYLGTHAAGVVVTGQDIQKYLSFRRYKNNILSAYDHFDVEKVNALKFDVLGLRTMSIMAELEKLTGKVFNYSWFDDKAVYEEFRRGNTTGIFQFESPTAKSILQEIDADCMEDIIAGNALNRPGPLGLKMPQQYGANKQDATAIKGSKYYEFTKRTYGTIVYQEQITAICRGLGGMTFQETDDVLKLMKSHGYKAGQEEKQKALRNTFVKGCMSHGMSKDEANSTYDKMEVYSFNKGHAVGYAMVGFQLMWYKVYYPIQFWYTVMKYAETDDMLMKYKLDAVKQGNVVMLPHVNRSKAQYSIAKYDGEYCLQEGLVNIKKVGEKAALHIEQERAKNGIFKDFDDFYDRCKMKGSPVNKGVIEALKEHGALEFKKSVYISRTVKYNSALYLKGLR